MIRMKYFIYITSILGIAFLASCSSNQDLMSLEEYDDLYYTPSDVRPAEPVAYQDDALNGASSAESTYYGESPFEDEQGKPSSEFESKENEEGEDGEFEDYYDPDYARRIENFHRNDEDNYVYSDAFGNNMQPRVNVGFGFNSFNGFGGWGMGVSMGSPWMGNRWCDPFFDPWCRCNPYMGPRFGMGWSPWGPSWSMGWNMGWGSTWSMYDPFSPWYNPYMGWGNPWAWNPWYGPGVIIVDGSGSGTGIQNTTRNHGSRTSRGGVVYPSGDRQNAVNGDVKSNELRSDSRGTDRPNDVRRSRPVPDGSTDYFNQRESQRYRTDYDGRDGRSSSDYYRSRNNQDRSSRNSSVISPYTRQQQDSRTRSNDYLRYDRPRNNTNNYRSTPQRRNSGFDFNSSPSRNTSPSYSPSRSSSPSVSPSRSGGSRRR